MPTQLRTPEHCAPVRGHRRGVVRDTVPADASVTPGASGSAHPLSRVHGACRDAAGLAAGVAAVSESAEIPLGEFADGLARLMPGFEGPGARRPTSPSPGRSSRRSRCAR